MPENRRHDERTRIRAETRAPSRRLRRSRAPREWRTEPEARDRCGWLYGDTVLDAGITTYETEQLANGAQQRTTVGPDGTATASVQAGDGTVTTTMPDGTVTVAAQGPDPRFGLATPIATSTTVETPGGREMTIERSRAVVLDDPEDPLSVVSSTETTIVNGKTAQTVPELVVLHQDHRARRGALKKVLLSSLPPAVLGRL